MADHKSAIADKSEKERWGKTMHRDTKATSLSCQKTRSTLEKKKRQ